MQEKQCIEHLTSMLQPLVANQGPAHPAPDACAGAQAGLSLELLNEVREMILLLAPRKEDMQGIVWVLDSWDVGGPQNRAVDLLRKFPGVGRRVIEARRPTRQRPPSPARRHPASLSPTPPRVPLTPPPPHRTHHAHRWARPCATRGRAPGDTAGRSGRVGAMRACREAHAGGGVAGSGRVPLGGQLAGFHT